MDNQEYKNILFEDHEQFTAVTSVSITEHGRWNTYFKQVFKKLDGTFWELSWSCGSTEQQDEGSNNFIFFEVIPKQKTVTVYEPKINALVE